jgi:glutamate carboxypeptidase
MRIRIVTVALLLSCAGATAAVGAPDSKVWPAARAAYPEQLKLLESVVDVDSGTGDADGGKKVGAIFIPRLQAFGASVKTFPAEAPGLPDNIVATVTGTGTAKILMIGHLDTVFGPGTVAKWHYHVAGNRAMGPGVGDEKGGVVEGIYALKILHDLGFKNFARITFLIETSEERGSPGTRALIDRLLGENDVELNMEPGDAPDVITVWRKGSATFHIDVTGKAAHAGVNPQDGRNAAVELIHQLAIVDTLPHSGTGTTANLTILEAGTRANIIPDHASAQINVRIREMSELDRIEKLLQKNAQTTVIPGTHVVVSREAAYPPLPNNPGTDALAARAGAIYAQLGKTVGLGGNGGASESALAAVKGKPALDGLGPVGGNFHSDGEYIDLTTVTPRLYLMTKLLMDLSDKPLAVK